MWHTFEHALLQGEKGDPGPLGPAGNRGPPAVHYIIKLLQLI